MARKSVQGSLLCVCMYVCMYVCVYVCREAWHDYLCSVCVCVCAYVYVYVDVDVYVNVYVYVYVHTYVSAHVNLCLAYAPLKSHILPAWRLRSYMQGQ
jgi:hypothetical protein